jgi:hypothetical protein
VTTIIKGRYWFGLPARQKIHPVLTQRICDNSTSYCASLLATGTAEQTQQDKRFGAGLRESDVTLRSETLKPSRSGDELDGNRQYNPERSIMDQFGNSLKSNHFK